MSLLCSVVAVEPELSAGLPLPLCCEIAMFWCARHFLKSTNALGDNNSSLLATLVHTHDGCRRVLRRLSTRKPEMLFIMLQGC